MRVHSRGKLGLTIGSRLLSAQGRLSAGRPKRCVKSGKMPAPSAERDVQSDPRVDSNGARRGRSGHLKLLFARAPHWTTLSFTPHRRREERSPTREQGREAVIALLTARAASSANRANDF